MARASKSAEQFAAEVGEVAPDVEVLEPYVNARTKVRCRCRVCGCEWEATPNHLLRGSGCPACAGTIRLSPEEFAARVRQASPLVQLLDGYVNARTRVSCRCTVCGHEWQPLPKGLLQGNGCPRCAGIQSAERLRAMWEKGSEPEQR